MQGELLRSVAEQSEREYLDKAILLSSLKQSSPESNLQQNSIHGGGFDCHLNDEEFLLQQAQLDSVRDFEAIQDKQLQDVTAQTAIEGSLISFVLFCNI